MKFKLIILLAIIFNSNYGVSQSCLPNGIIFSTQQEINDFKINYPNCKEIIGNVSIQETTNNDIINLNGLSQIVIINGNLNLSFNSKLTDLSGLTQLKTIRGNFIISNNSALENFSGIDKINSILGHIDIYHNKALSDLKGLENLQYIEKNLKINYNDKLKNLEGLNSLEYVKGDFEILYNEGLINFQGLNNLKKLYGDFFVRLNKSLIDFYGLENLEIIRNDFIIEANESLINFSGLDKLDKIRFSLIIKNNNALINLNGINNLDSIRYVDFIITDNDNLTDLSSLESLVYVDKSIIIKNNNSLKSLSGLESITEINRNLEISSNTILTDLSALKNIKSINGDFIFFKNNSIVVFSELNQLDSIKGKIEFRINSALKTLAGFKKLKYIGKSLQFDNNQILENVPAFKELQYIGGYISIYENDSLKYLPRFEKLDSIGGNFNISSLPNLVNLSGLESLKSVGDRFSIRNCKKIKSFSGLENLKKIGNSMYINYNEELNSLYGLHNIDPYSIKSPHNFTDLDISYNPKLSNCEIKNLCEYLRIPNGNTSIRNNATGCNSPEEINCYNYGISGTVFYDYNQNKVQDFNESGIFDSKVLFKPDDNLSITNQLGQYLYLCDSGVVYTCSLIVPPNWKLTTDSLSYNILFNQGNPSVFNNNFGIIPTYDKHDGLVNLSSNQTRCNTNVNFFLGFKNTGTFKESGQITLQYDNSSTYVSATPLPDDIDRTNHTLKWNYDTLFPYEFKEYKISFRMPDQNSTGDPISFNAKMTRDSFGTQIPLDNSTYSQIIRCSYDPNDKLVSPTGVRDENFTLRDETLTYTIRFQNTGNAEAIDIKILDTLDTNLDMSTFHVLNSSFPVQTIVDGHKIEFLFSKIWLPDSTSNEPASHGFVTYEIKPMEGLDDYTKIENTAYIIFDFNPAIVTNTISNTMVTTIPVGISKIDQNNIVIYPNPSSDIVYIDFHNTDISNAKINVIDISGKNHITIQKTNKDKTISIDSKSLLSGLYFIKIELFDNVFYRKLVIDR